MPVLGTPVKNRPSKRGSRASRALSHIRVSRVISLLSNLEFFRLPQPLRSLGVKKEEAAAAVWIDPILLVFDYLHKTFSDVVSH
jgi:hypothetical protein